MKFIPFLIALSAVCVITPAHAGELRAAAVKVDITPDRPQQMRGYGLRLSTGVHMPIYHRVLALDDGERRLIIASTEVCLIRPNEYDRVAELVEKRFQIPSVDFLWTTTHTHSAPEIGPAGIGAIYMPERHTHEPDHEYTRFTTDQLLRAIEQALANLAPARLGLGWGESEANINRRERRADGSIALGQNPQGAIDRRVGVIHLLKKDSDEPVATLANYAIHATVLGSKNLLISGDAPGVVSAHVEATTGVPMLFINGAAGNIAPIYSVFPTPEAGRLDEFKTLLGDEILTTMAGIQHWRSSLSLHPGEVVLETRRKKDMAWPDDLAHYTRDDESGQPLVLMPCRTLRIDDDIMIWTAPIELFCEVSNAVRETSPFPHTFYFGYTNGWLGYLPTKQAFSDGGYEPRVTPFRPEAAEKLTTLMEETIRDSHRAQP